MLRKLLLVFVCIFAFCSVSFARPKYQDFAHKGGKSVKTSASTTYNLDETYPNCTITVYQTGTLILANLFSNNSGTPKTNPFTASSDASFFFYIDSGRYDIKFSGTGITTPFTRSDILLGGDSPIVDSSIYDNLLTAVNTIGATSTTLQISTTNWPNGGNTTVPATLQLDFVNGGSISVTTGQTVNILSEATKWPKRKIFNNAIATGGTINFDTNYSISDIYFEWWGASPTTAAATNTPAVQATIRAAFGNANRTNINGLWVYNRNLKFLGNYQINDELKVYHMIGFSWQGENKFNSGFTQTATNKRIIDGQSIAYGVFKELNFSSQATQGVGIPFIDLNYDGSQGNDLRPQNITFQDCVFSGNNISLMGVWIARAGGGAQGDNIRFYNCYGSGFTHSAATIGGNNTSPLTNSALAFNGLHVQWEGGDIQGCPLYGLAAYGGNWIIHNASFENQGGTLSFQTGYDVLCDSFQVPCIAKDIRSESLRFSNGVSVIENVNTTTPFAQPWENTNVSSAAPISAITNANPAVITVPPNFLSNGDVVNIYGVTGTLGSINGPRVVTQITSTTYSIPFNTTALSAYGGSGATAQNSQFVSGKTVGVDYGVSGTGFGGDGKLYRVTVGGTFGGLAQTLASAGGASTITVPGTPWTVNAFTGYKVTLFAGTGSPSSPPYNTLNPFGGSSGSSAQTRIVASNTNNTITTTTPWTVIPDSTTVFVVEPNWGTQFTSGTVTWVLYDYFNVEGAQIIKNSKFLGGKISFINGLSAVNFDNLTISRTDAIVSSGGQGIYDGQSYAKLSNIFVISGPANGVGPMGYFKWTTPSVNGNLGGNLQTDYATNNLGVQKICWSGADFGDPNSRWSDICIGRGDGIRGDSGTQLSRNILSIKGILGKDTPVGTDQNGLDTNIQVGLATGAGIPGNFNIYAAGGIGTTGTAVRTGVPVAGVSGRNGVSWTLIGAPVASAAAIAPTGNTFHVTGVTNITSITLTGVPAGAEITIIFDGVLTFTDGGNLKLAGNFVTTADDTITLICDGTNCYEKARSVN